MPQPGWHTIVGSRARIETIVPAAAQVFMNERDALVSGMLGRDYSQVQNYTFGILSTVRLEHGYSTRQLGEAAERGEGRRSAHASSSLPRRADDPSLSVDLLPPWVRVVPS